jgi:hypothetical protein
MSLMLLGGLVALRHEGDQPRRGDESPRATVARSAVYTLMGYYCRLEYEGVGDLVIRFPQPDHRKSRFGLRYSIKLILEGLCHDEARILIFDDPAEEIK